MRLAVVDTDTSFTRVVGNRAQAAGWELSLLAVAPQPEELVSLRVGAVLVDLATMGEEGWEWLQQTCHGLPDLPVLVCTAQSSVAERVRGLRIGADDWITKPVHGEEVLARVEAVVRRRRRAVSQEAGDPLRAGLLEIRPDRFQAYAEGRSARLTLREFEVLRLLAEEDGRVLEREQIYQRVWGYGMAHGDRSVDVFVRKVRAKIERVSPGWDYIHTHFGVGYRFQAEPRAGTEAAGAAARHTAAT